MRNDKTPQKQKKEKKHTAFFIKIEDIDII